MTHDTAPAQNKSCAGAFAKPPGESTPMSVDSGALFWVFIRVTL
jgi:hypothetical protein